MLGLGGAFILSLLASLGSAVIIGKRFDRVGPSYAVVLALMGYVSTVPLFLVVMALAVESMVTEAVVHGVLSSASVVVFFSSLLYITVFPFLFLGLAFRRVRVYEKYCETMGRGRRG